MNNPKVLQREILAQGRFLQLENLTWQTGQGIEHQWEKCSRVGAQKSVAMICLLKPSDRYLLIRQYRPPLEKYVLEFPAGLVDEGESDEAAALRELREETGYHGLIKENIGPRANSPGMISECTSILLLDIDETDPLNQKPEQDLEGIEDIEILLLTEEEILNRLSRHEEYQEVGEAKVTSFFLGKRVASEQHQ